LELKIDLHVHSVYSDDSLITTQSLRHYVRKNGLDAVAITDHDRIEGAREVAKSVEFPIIPGVEVSSSDGHIVGLDVNEPIPRELDAEETVERIHHAGGLAIACHPGGLFKRSIGDRSNANFDAVEVINSSAFPFSRSVSMGERLANRLKASKVGGSDAHYGPEIGWAYTVVDASLETDEIIKAIRRGKCHPEGRAIPLFLRITRRVLTTFSNRVR
jgi:predicted metal-dependent phosphoesterase TrpH